MAYYKIDRIMKAVLFDIDGTIMNCHGAGKLSLIKATREVFGTHGDMEDVDFQGRTDPLIIHESLKSQGFSEVIIAGRIDELKKRYFYHLDMNIGTHEVILMPGIEELLTMISKTDTIIPGLLTGNFRESAEIKLNRFNLYHFFSFGVFGSDTENRNDMPGIARTILNKKFSIDIEFRDMTIIGDTVHDIECTKKAGAVSVAVGTGWTHRDILLEHGPDYFFNTLSDVDSVMDIILCK